MQKFPGYPFPAFVKGGVWGGKHGAAATQQSPHTSGWGWGKRAMEAVACSAHHPMTTHGDQHFYFQTHSAMLASLGPSLVTSVEPS